MKMTTLAHAKSKLGDYLEQLERNELSLQAADTRANLIGKFIKAEALEFAREAFAARLDPMPLLPTEDKD